MLLHGDTNGVMPRPEWDLPAESVPGLPLAPGLQWGQVSRATTATREQGHPGWSRDGSERCPSVPQLPRRDPAPLQGDLQDTDGAGMALLPWTHRSQLRGRWELVWVGVLCRVGRWHQGLWDMDGSVTGHG